MLSSKCCIWYFTCKSAIITKKTSLLCAKFYWQIFVLYARMYFHFSKFFSTVYFSNLFVNFIWFPVRCSPCTIIGLILWMKQLKSLGVVTRMIFISCVLVFIVGCIHMLILVRLLHVQWPTGLYGCGFRITWIAITFACFFTTPPFLIRIGLFY